jgi:glyoxylase-like metal-dependent hydrolase (beta-lactamase superfamily II)/8-oxo-dGTP pyrophosphatase MutT (NUDIX family)
MTKTIRKAVAIIFIYQDEVFFIKRQNHLRAFPGYTAFPGGKHDAQDSSLFYSLKREVKEELQFDLGYEQDISLFAKATSPDHNPVRYETYFYISELREKPSFFIDQNEVAEFLWTKPGNILEQYKLGKRLLVTPMLRILKMLDEKNYSFIDFDNEQSSLNIIPCVESIYGLKQFIPLSNTIMPATRTNSFLVGDDRRILIDPSPKDEEEYSKFLTTLKSETIDAVLITHHHGDHHQYANKLALERDVPVLISKDSFERIQKKNIPFFEGLKVEYLKEGDIVTTWQGLDVLAFEIPGHDEGHIGLAPKALDSTMDWFIVGDLFQGVGTVVVGGAEGNMKKYMASLKRVIELEPRCVIPSHGIPLGGTCILEKTLNHRIIREQQILDLLNKKKSVDEILNIIYFNIPHEVLKYARANIMAHIDKLKEEGQI